MEKSMIRVLALLAGSAALSFSAASAMAQAAAKLTAKGSGRATQVCAACHGADGNSVAPINPGGVLVPAKQLVNFKAQGGKKAERENGVMAGMVANLSAEDMKNLSAYYAGQKLKPAVAKDKDLVAEGQRLWRGGNAATGIAACAGCHGPDGMGVPAQYPRLAGQYAEYIEAQLKLFKSGQRANDPNRMMRGVVERMTEREMKAVAEYAAALR
jgi:cytochrome c553